VARRLADEADDRIAVANELFAFPAPVLFFTARVDVELPATAVDALFKPLEVFLISVGVAHEGLRSAPGRGTKLKP
jgi:hypothetical protein